MVKGTRNRSRQRVSVPKHLLQNLVQDLVTMMENEESHPLALELVDQLPHEMQTVFIENLSSIHRVELAQFFWLVAEEYSGEVQKAAKRALEKYRLMGLPIDEWKVSSPPAPENFFVAMATKSRFLGQISLIMAWEQPNNLLDVRYFVLKFGPEGIHRYFRVDAQSKKSFFVEHNLTDSGMVDLSLAEAQFLIQEAYFYNQVYETQPARPVFQYVKWLENKEILTPEEVQQLDQKLFDGKLSPTQVVNAHLLAEKNGDFSLVHKLSTPESEVGSQERETYVRSILDEEPEEIEYCLLSEIEQEDIRRKTAEILVRIVVSTENQVQVRTCLYTLMLKKWGWLVHHVAVQSVQELDEDDPANPLNSDVYCALYSVSQRNEILSFIAELPEVEIFAEMEAGTHYRWMRYPNLLDKGLNIAEMVFCEFLFTGHELLVVAQERNNLDAICTLVEERLAKAVKYEQQYYVDIGLVYAVLGGDYGSFEELLGELAIEEEADSEPVMLARYQILNLPAVLDQIRSFTVFEFLSPEGEIVFYEFEQIQANPKGGEMGEGFVAEYRIFREELRVAAFGQEYLTIVCQELEQALPGVLVPVEIKEEDQRLPLITAMKNSYLTKEAQGLWQQKELEQWLNRQLPILEGMSPKEATQSLTGQQLLWDLFKNMQQMQKNLLQIGLRPAIDYREYVRLVSLADATWAP